MGIHGRGMMGPPNISSVTLERIQINEWPRKVSPLVVRRTGVVTPRTTAPPPVSSGRGTFGCSRTGPHCLQGFVRQCDRSPPPHSEAVREVRKRRRWGHERIHIRDLRGNSLPSASRTNARTAPRVRAPSVLGKGGFRFSRKWRVDV